MTEFETTIGGRAHVERLIEAGVYNEALRPPAEPTFPQFVGVPGRNPNFVGREDELAALGPGDASVATGPDHPHALTARANLAASYFSAGRAADAIPVEEQVVVDRERILGSDHPDTLLACANLAHSYWSAQRRAEAIALMEGRPK